MAQPLIHGVTVDDLFQVPGQPPLVDPQPFQSFLALDYGKMRTGVATGNRMPVRAPPGKSIAATGDANASGGTIAGTGAITGGTATGAVSFTTSAMENNAGSLLASTAVVWEWHQGGTIGAAPVSVTYGSGTTNASGILTVSGIPAGAGELLVATPDVVSVFYQRGDAA